MEPGTIRNFVEVDDRLATAGQPTELQLRSLKEHGFEVVVNLGLLDPRYCLPDEAGTAASSGLIYHHIPIDFRNPTDDDFERFVQVMRAVRDKKTLVHCAMNYRVSCFVALFGERELGWSRERADVHVKKLWQPDEVWSAFLQRMRQKTGA